MEQGNESDEDLNYFKSLVPHVKKLPSINKLRFRSRIQDALIEELYALQSGHPQQTPIQNQPSPATTSLSGPTSVISYIQLQPHPQQQQQWLQQQQQTYQQQQEERNLYNL